MNKIKKLSIAFLVLAMVALMGLTAFAIDSTGVNYTAKITDNPIRCVGTTQPITVAINATEVIDLFSLDVTVKLPDGWKVIKFESESLGITTEDYSAEDGRLVWYNVDASNVTTMNIATITVEIPSTAIVGEYAIGFASVEFGKITGENSGDYVGQTITDLTATVTLKDHTYALDTANGDGGYAWAKTGDNWTCTAYGKCTTCTKTTEVIATASGKEKTPATCLAKGWTTYTANFSATSWATTQSIDVEDLDQKEHSYTGTPKDNKDGTHSYMCKNGCQQYSAEKEAHSFSAADDTCVCKLVCTHALTYTDNKDGTHTAICMCGKGNVTVDHTYDQAEGTKCVCGAEKPVTPAGLKGDVDLDGTAGTLEDLTMLARHYMTYEEILNTQSLVNGDIDGNGTVELEDLTALARFYMGYDTTLG